MMGVHILRHSLKAFFLCNFLLLASAGFFSSSVDIDENGYVLFCPGMGGFDNQVEQFLGALDFARELNRTIVLPHWIEYHTTDRDSDQIEFEKYFKIAPIQKRQKAITMDSFMSDIASSIWPKGKRTVFCFTYRGGEDSESCHAKEGNPFGPYWNKFKINFEKNIKFAPLSYDMDNEDNKAKWLETFPKDKYPVLAFTSTPGDFPILKHNVHLQEHLQWSDEIEKQANNFIGSFKKNKKDIFLGLHLKNGIEHYRACEHAAEIKYDTFFSSAQCLGYSREYGTLTNDLCYPGDHQLLDQLNEVLTKLKPKYVFVVSEIHDIVERFIDTHKDIKFVELEKKNAHVELAVLGKADHAIVNCVSVASAFVKRHRDVDNLPTDFWTFKKKEILDDKAEL